ncbi:hypothetical protein Pelo_17801 [Pelomyxa schiedti]|nr:hypothetical protein Pelo_17801 [Pelomyxa schiedti]
MRRNFDKTPNNTTCCLVPTQLFRRESVNTMPNCVPLNHVMAAAFILLHFLGWLELITTAAEREDPDFIIPHTRGTGTLLDDLMILIGSKDNISTMHMADGAAKGGVGKVSPSRNGESAAATRWRKRREHDDEELFVVDGPPEALEIPRTARRLLGVTLAELPPDDIFASFAGSREIWEVGRLGESMRIYVIFDAHCSAACVENKEFHRGGKAYWFVQLKAEWVYHSGSERPPFSPPELESPLCRRIFRLHKSTPVQAVTNHFLAQGITPDWTQPYNNHFYICFMDESDAKRAIKIPLPSGDYIFTSVPSAEFQIPNLTITKYQNERYLFQTPRKKACVCALPQVIEGVQPSSKTQFQAFHEEASKLKSWCMQCQEIVIDGSTFISEFSVRKTQFNNLKIQCDKLVEKRDRTRAALSIMAKLAPLWEEMVKKHTAAELVLLHKELEQKDRETKSWLDQKRKELSNEAVKTYTSLKSAEKAVHEFRVLEVTLKREANVKVSNLKRCTLHMQELEDGTATTPEHHHPEAAMMDGNGQEGQEEEEERSSSGLLSQLRPEIEAVLSALNDEISRLSKSLQSAQDDLADKEAEVNLWVTQERDKMDTAAKGLAYTSVKQAQQALSNLERDAPSLKKMLEDKLKERRTLQLRVKDIELGDAGSGVVIAAADEGNAGALLDASIATLESALKDEISRLSKSLQSSQDEFVQCATIASKWCLDTSKTFAIPTDATFAPLDFGDLNQQVHKFVQSCTEVMTAMNLRVKEVYALQNRLTNFGGTPDSATIAAFSSAKALLVQAIRRSCEAHKAIVEKIPVPSPPPPPAPPAPAAAPGTIVLVPLPAPPRTATLPTMPGTTAATRTRTAAVAHAPPHHTAMPPPHSSHSTHHHHARSATPTGDST